MPIIQVPVLVNAGEAQVLVCTTIPLPSPALEIVEIRKTIIIDACTVIPNKVIIDGRLRKNIVFKTLCHGHVPRDVGVVTACSGIVSTASGDVVHTTVDIAFNALISVHGAKPGDICEVQQAFVEGEADEAAKFKEDGTFTELVEKSVIRLCVAVKRTRALSVSACEEKDICPPSETAGVPVTGEVRLVKGGVQQGAKPGTAVGPTILFGGPTVVKADP